MNDEFDVEVFYDGDCPLCMKEIVMLRRMDRAGRIRFTDIAAPGFDSSETGLSWDQLMERIHGRMPGGEMIEGVEVFRQLYSAIGFRALVAPTRLPGVSHALEAGYRLFATNRLRLTGRCDADGCSVSQQAVA